MGAESAATQGSWKKGGKQEEAKELAEITYDFKKLQEIDKASREEGWSKGDTIFAILDQLLDDNNLRDCVVSELQHI